MSNYDMPGQAINQLVEDGKFEESFRDDLFQELTKVRDISSQFFDEIPAAFEITRGTNLLFVEGGGELDLSGIDRPTARQLNAIFFSTDDDVDLTLPNQFRGTVVLGDGNNSLEANNAVIVYSGAGNDTINTGRGNDLVVTGEGDDFVDTGNGRDTIVVGSGNDTINAGNGRDLIIVEKGEDTDNTIVIDGGRGRDTLDLSDVVITSISVTGTNARGRPTSVQIELEHGTTLDVTNVERFIYDVNGDGLISRDETLTLIGLLDIDFDAGPLG
ncbi:calcium-binding protein [Methylotuvimicrobium buryatense]|uniref:EF-hand domain-containing protein n=1 Tax=Methylotuvimicrobium buryatense TaxID=95641 RepID=A0A4V1IK81_METBY|nr:hypothetical protein [Methylotuvimicrobium buryatense]QCW83985.1 hypothetical protein EQU24_18355 [Methylotuvimicrobium buryatense]